MKKTLTAIALVAALGVAGAANAQVDHFANWMATDTPGKANVCLMVSMDTTNKVDAAFSVTFPADPQLRMDNMSGPHAKLADGKVEIRIDGQVAVTATGEQDTNDVLAVKLTPSQFADFLKKVGLSHRMTITLGDGSTSDYVTEAGMVGAYIAMGKCLDAMMHQ
jgi:hypothetical protein